MMYLIGVWYDDFRQGGFSVMAVTSEKKNLLKIKQEILESHPEINPVFIVAKYYCEGKVYSEGPIFENIE